MELFLASIALIAFCTSASAIEEHIRWVDSYHEAGEEDHQYHLEKQSNYDIGYHE